MEVVVARMRYELYRKFVNYTEKGSAQLIPVITEFGFYFNGGLD